MTKKGARQHKEDGRAKEKWQELNKDVEERTIGFISADCHQSVTRGNKVTEVRTGPQTCLNQSGGKEIILDSQK